MTRKATTWTKLRVSLIKQRKRELFNLVSNVVLGTNLQLWNVTEAVNSAMSGYWSRTGQKISNSKTFLTLQKLFYNTADL